MSHSSFCIVTNLKYGYTRRLKFVFFFFIKLSQINFWEVFFYKVVPGQFLNFFFFIKLSQTNPFHTTHSTHYIPFLIRGIYYYLLLRNSADLKNRRWENFPKLSCKHGLKKYIMGITERRFKNIVLHWAFLRMLRLKMCVALTQLLLLLI